MSVKEFVSGLIRDFFILTTLICIGVGILGMIFQPETRFGYEALFMPIIYAIAGLIPSAVMYSKRELTVKEVIIRKAIQCLLIEAIVVGLIFGSNILKVEYRSIILGVMISILVIFVLCHLISAFMEYLDAKKMNADLEAFLIKNREE